MSNSNVYAKNQHLLSFYLIIRSTKLRQREFNPCFNVFLIILTINFSAIAIFKHDNCHILCDFVNLLLKDFFHPDMWASFIIFHISKLVKTSFFIKIDNSFLCMKNNTFSVLLFYILFCFVYKK